MIRGLLARVRSFLAGVTGGSAVDADMRAEFEHHIEHGRCTVPNYI